MTHVRLASTTLNESKSLPALVDGCVEMGVSSYVIMDDLDSDDGTAELATELFAAAGIPGRVIKGKFDTLAEKRNALLNDPTTRDGCDYLFITQSDEPPTGPLQEELTEQFYLLRVKDYGNDGDSAAAPMEWDMPLLIRSDVRCHWTGTVHELLVWDENVTGVKLDSPVIQRYGSVATRETRELHVKILREEYEQNGSSRSAFYLAQTLQCLGRNEDALNMYLIRAEMPGNDEEAFISYYRAGLITETYNPAKACGYYLDALGRRPFRKEPMFRLAHIANGMKNYEMALMFANKGLAMPDTNDVAFVERWVECWGLEFEWSVAAWNSGIPSSLDVMDNLLKRDDLHPLTRTWLEHNRALPFEPKGP